MAETTVPISRRQFCASACQAASTATLATLVTACGGGADSPTSPSGRTSTLPVSAGRFTGTAVQVTTTGTALDEVGGAVLVESTAGVFLVSRPNATTFQAVDAVCSHQSCTITGADGAVFVCQCHGSRYSRSGQVLGGPAMASLRQFATSFGDGVVTIRL